MESDKQYTWIRKDKNRDVQKVLMSMNQPLTAKQISRKTGIPIDTCSYIMCKFASKGIVSCLNPTAQNSRVYWLTDLGKDCRDRLHQEKSLTVPEIECDIANVDWDTYGWACYNHRSAIIRVLTEPMQPSGIKQKLRQVNPKVKISANNIRDIIKLFMEKGIVKKVFVRKKAHPRYELTDQGTEFQQLLNQAHMPL